MHLRHLNQSLKRIKRVLLGDGERTRDLRRCQAMVTIGRSFLGCPFSSSWDAPGLRNMLSMYASGIRNVKSPHGSDGSASKVAASSPLPASLRTRFAGRLPSAGMVRVRR